MTLRQFPPSLLLVALFTLNGASANAQSNHQINFSPQDITLEEFESRYSHDYPEPKAYKASDVQYLDKFEAAYGLEDAEKKQLLSRNVVVTERLSSESFGTFYYDLYHQELPVLVTTDAILFALHTTYDSLLADMERVCLYPQLSNMLQRMQLEFKKNSSAYRDAGVSKKNLEDIDLYLAVGRCLLYNDEIRNLTEHCLFNDTPDRTDKFLKLIEAKQQVKVEIFGMHPEWNFGAFEPMGHYRKNDFLEAYWQAMVWLRMADFTLSDERQRVDAILLMELLKPVRQEYAQMESLIELLVGRSERITLLQIDELAVKTNLTDLKSRLSNQTRLWERVASDENNREQILGKVTFGSVDKTGKNIMPIVTGLFGKRWALDAYVIDKVTYDRIQYKGESIDRRTPSGLDIAFALGNDRAAVHLKDELSKFPYFNNLAGLREMTDSLQANFWEESYYNIWLGALKGLNNPVGDARYPLAMRGKEWRDKTLNTQLVGLTQVRHANQLYNPPGYFGNTCDFPLAYAEPYPEFYHKLGLLASKWNELIKRLNAPPEMDLLPEGYNKQMAEEYKTIVTTAGSVFQQWEICMKMLEEISIAELNGAKLTKEQEYFLKDIMEVGQYYSPGSGAVPVPLYSGWYPKLFYPIPKRCQAFNPLVVAAGYDPTNPRYLEMATGLINSCLIILEIDHKPTLFTGPVGSYYEFFHSGTVPLVDEEWRKQVADDKTNKLTANPKKSSSPLRTINDPKYRIETPTWKESYLTRNTEKKLLNCSAEKVLVYLPQYKAAKAGIGESVWAMVIDPRTNIPDQYHCNFLDMTELDLVMPEGTPEGLVDLEIKIKGGIVTEVNVTQSSDKRLEKFALGILDELAFSSGSGDMEVLQLVTPKTRLSSKTAVIEKNDKQWVLEWGRKPADFDKLELRVRFDKATLRR